MYSLYMGTNGYIGLVPPKYPSSYLLSSQEVYQLLWQIDYHAILIFSLSIVFLDHLEII